MLQPGQVVLIDRKHLPHIGHDKFALCVCPGKLFFFYINTKSRFPANAQAQVLGKIELPFLGHTSYVDTSQVHTFLEHAIREALTAGKVWTTPRSVVLRVLEVMNAHDLLPPKTMKAINDSLR